MRRVDDPRRQLIVLTGAGADITAFESAARHCRARSSGRGVAGRRDRSHRRFEPRPHRLAQRRSRDRRRSRPRGRRPGDGRLDLDLRRPVPGRGDDAGGRVPARPADGRRAPVRDRRSRPRPARRPPPSSSPSTSSAPPTTAGPPATPAPRVAAPGSASTTRAATTVPTVAAVPVAEPTVRPCRRRTRRRAGALARGRGGGGRRPRRRRPRRSRRCCASAARDRSESAPAATRRRSRPTCARCARPGPDPGCPSCGGARPPIRRDRGPPHRCPRGRRRRGSRPASPRDHRWS